MAVTLTLIGKTPGQSQFGLDQFIEHHKTDTTADVVLTDPSVPQKGDAHPDYAFMFLTDRRVQETSASSSALDLIYQGILNIVDGLPVMPPAQHTDDTAVMSASSSKNFAGQTLLSPLTAQYYAPTTQKTFLTYGGKATADQFVADPTDDIVIITLTTGDTTYTPTGLLADTAALFFTPQIIHTLQAPEIVAGQFWQNISKKTKNLSPWIFSVSAGEYIVMYAPGGGYTVGNSVTMNDGMGHTAVLSITRVGVGNSIAAWTVTSNTFDYTTPSPIFVSGGSGSGAAFYNYHIS
jgi:hypothetical protein